MEKASAVVTRVVSTVDMIPGRVSLIAGHTPGGRGAGAAPPALVMTAPTPTVMLNAIPTIKPISAPWRARQEQEICRIPFSGDVGRDNVNKSQCVY